MKNDTYSLSYFMQKVASAPIKPNGKPITDATMKGIVSPVKGIMGNAANIFKLPADKRAENVKRWGSAVKYFNKHKDLDYKKILKDSAKQISADIIRKKKNNIPLTSAEKASILGNVLWEGGLNQDQRSEMLRNARYMDTLRRNQKQVDNATVANSQSYFQRLLSPGTSIKALSGDYDAARPLQNSDYKGNVYTTEEKLVDYYAKHAPDSWISDKQLLDNPTAQHESAKAQEKIHNAAAPWVNFGKWALPIAGLGIPLAALWAMWGRNKKKGGKQQPRLANPYEQGYAYSYNRQRPPSKRSPYQRSPFNIRG